jgi:hypothetical protein
MYEYDAGGEKDGNAGDVDCDVCWITVVGAILWDFG